MPIKTNFIPTFAALLLTTLAATPANAKLVISIHTADGSSSIWFVRPHDGPIPLYIYAAVTGTPGKAAAEYLSSIQGSIVSTKYSWGSARGNIAPAVTYPNSYYTPDDPSQGPEMWGPMVPWGDPYNDRYSFGSLFNPELQNSGCNGKSQDLNGDGDLDLGGKPGATDLDWIRLRSPKNGGESWGTGGRGTKLADGGVEFLVGQITFTPKNFSDPDALTIIRFCPRTDATGHITKEAALWQEDGTSLLNQKTGLTGTVESIAFTIGRWPEPSTLSLLPLATLFLFPRRRTR